MIAIDSLFSTTEFMSTDPKNMLLNVKKHPNTKDDFTLLKKSAGVINFMFKNITNNTEIIDDLHNNY
jgi:hypothetical protein